jgi:hypothetical protein
VFENRVLRGIFGPKRDDIIGGRKNCLISFITCVLFSKCNYNDKIKEDEKDRGCSTHGGKGGMHTRFWWQSRKEKATRKT